MIQFESNTQQAGTELWLTVSKNFNLDNAKLGIEFFKFKIQNKVYTKYTTQFEDAYNKERMWELLQQ